MTGSNTDKKKILIIEDDREILRSVALLLEKEDFTVAEAADGTEGLIELTPDVRLIILDIMLPGMSGYEVCRAIRRKSFVPILFLTARSGEDDIIEGFRSGADDYLTKPFLASELIIRVRAMIRRNEQYNMAAMSDPSSLLTLHGICINQKYNYVIRGGKEVVLTETEYRILLTLMQSPGTVFSVRQLYESIWKEPFFRSSANTIMVHIRNLRKKLEKDPQVPELILTVWGRGYTFRG